MFKFFASVPGASERSFHATSTLPLGTHGIEDWNGRSVNVERPVEIQVNCLTVPTWASLMSPLNESNRKQLFSQQKLRLLAHSPFPFVHCSTQYLVGSYVWIFSGRGFAASENKLFLGQLFRPYMQKCSKARVYYFLCLFTSCTKHV
jgi:hypothetical protein